MKTQMWWELEISQSEQQKSLEMSLLIFMFQCLSHGAEKFSEYILPTDSITHYWRVSGANLECRFV